MTKIKFFRPVNCIDPMPRHFCNERNEENPTGKRLNTINRIIKGSKKRCGTIFLFSRSRSFNFLFLYVNLRSSAFICNSFYPLLLPVWVCLVTINILYISNIIFLTLTFITTCLGWNCYYNSFKY